MFSQLKKFWGLGVLLGLSACQPADSLQEPPSRSLSSLNEPAAKPELKPELAEFPPVPFGTGNLLAESRAGNLLAESRTGNLLAERTLESGWNLVSFPLTGQSQPSAFFREGMHSIWAYREGTWRVFPRTENFPLLEELYPDEGYWIKARQAGVTFSGQGVTQNSYNFVAGWNLIGYSHSVTAQEVGAFFQAGDFWKNSCGSGATLESVWGWVNGTWQLYFPQAEQLTRFNLQQGTRFEALPLLEPGAAYWVKAGRSNLPPPSGNCAEVPVQEASALGWQPIVYSNEMIMDVTSQAQGYLGVSTEGKLWTSPEGRQWQSGQRLSPLSFTGALQHQGQTLIVGKTPGVFTSEEEQRWTYRPIQTATGEASDHSYQDLLAGNGVFLALVDFHQPYLAFSPEGRTWREQRLLAPNLSTSYQMLAFGNGQFLYFQNTTPQAYLSSDGQNWIAHTATLSSSAFSWEEVAWQKMAYGNDRFLAIGGGAWAMTSSNGIAWQVRPLPRSLPLRDLAFGAGRFVAVGDQGEIWSTPDGITWTSHPWTFPVSFRKISYAHERFFLMSSGGTFLTSSDGMTWENIELHPVSGYLQGPLRASAFGQGLWVTAGQVPGFFSGDLLSMFYVSSDGRHWKQAVPGVEHRIAEFYGLAFGQGKFVAVGKPGRILSSPDGQTWQTILYGEGLPWFSVAFGAERFMAVGYAGQIITGSGESWHLLQSGTSASLLGVTHGEFGWVAVGEQGTLLLSRNSSTWERLASPTSKDLRSVAFGGGRYVAVGASGTTISSTGGAWKLNPSVTSRELTSVTYGEGKFWAVGFSGTVLTSSDGLTWTRELSNEPGSRTLPLHVQPLRSVTAAQGQVLVFGEAGTLWLKKL